MTRISSDSVTLVNIGNTHTQIAVAERGVVGAVRRVETATLSPADLPVAWPVAVASVVPAACARLQALRPLLVTAAAVSGIDWSPADVATFGADRVANVAMLVAAGRLPAVCIDCGTAITFEVVGLGRQFLGGSISPGRAMMRRALHDYTAQLPVLPWRNDLAGDKFGADTVAAMEQGIDRGAVGMVRELMTQAQRLLGVTPYAVAVGGDRGFFLRELPGLQDGGDDFTLGGILKIWEMNHAS